MVFKKLSILMSFLMLSASIYAGEISSSYCISNQNNLLRGGVKSDAECVPFTESQADFVAFNGTVQAIAGSGSIVALGFSNRVEIYEMSDPLEPFLMHTKNIYGPAKDMVIVGNRLIIAVENGIDAIDLGTFAYTHKITYGSTKSMRLYNGKIYVGDGQGIKVIDPLTLNILQQKNTSGDVKKIEILNGVIYTFEWAGLKRFNLETLASITTGSYNPSNVELRAYGNDLYAASGDTVMKISFNGSTVVRPVISGDKVELRNNHTIGQYTLFPEGSGLRMSYMETVCGNGVVEGDEMCDDGNSIDYDGCTNCEKDFYVGNPEECRTGRYCEFIYNADLIDYIRVGSQNDKEIIINIDFGDGGYFSKSLNYCLKNRYCFEDSSGNIIFKKKYFNDQIQPVTAGTISPITGSIDNGSATTGGEVEPCSGECFVIAATVKLTPQQYIYEHGNEDYIGSLFVATRLFDLSDRNVRATNDMRMHGWHRYFLKDTKIFIYADVPAGYEIKKFTSAGSYGWSMNQGTAPVLITKEGLVSEVADEIKLTIDGKDSLSDFEKMIAKGIVDNLAAGEDFYGSILNDPTLSEYMTDSEKAALSSLSNYKPSGFFALYKMIAPANFSTVEGELSYKGALRDLFDYNDPAVSSNKQSCPECWGKTGQEIWPELFRNINVYKLELCVDVGHWDTDDAVYVKFNNIDNQVIGNPIDGEAQNRPSLFYLDNAKNNFQAYTKDCFVIKTDQVVVDKVKDIQFIKIAKYPFYRDANRPDLNPGTEALSIKGIELFVNGELLFSKRYDSYDNGRGFFLDGNDGGEPYILINEEELQSNINYRFENSSEPVNPFNEFYNNYRVIDFMRTIPGSYLAQALECGVGHLTIVDNTYHKSLTGPDVDLSLETSADRVQLDYANNRLVEVEFGLTDQSWDPDLDMRVYADMLISTEEAFDKTGNFLGINYSLGLVNVKTSWDGWQTFLNLLSMGVVWLPLSTHTIGLVNYIPKFDETFYGIEFNNYVDKIDDWDLNSFDYFIANDLFFSNDSGEINLNVIYTDEIEALRLIYGVILTCIDEEREGSLDCLSEFPNTFNGIKELADGV